MRLAYAAIAAMILIAAPARAWHWSPPTTGSPVALYTIDVRDAWGTRIMISSSVDTAWASPPWLDHVAHHIAVDPVDADQRAGTTSRWSTCFIPRECAALWWVMGGITRTAQLSMIVAGYQATVAAWPDSLRTGP